MHDNQVNIPVEMVAKLVAGQFPQWADLAIRAIPSPGTVNALFRLGDKLVLRFPLIPSLDAELRQDLLDEQANARRIAAHVDLPVPEPVGFGEPTDDYPGPWTVYKWIDGETVTSQNLGDPHVFAADLAQFVLEFRTMDTMGRTWDGTWRGGPLSSQDSGVRKALDESTHLTDTVRLAKIWEKCLSVPHATQDLWIHADLMPGNLLVRDGRLSAVIDLGTARVADPAVDLMPAWNLLPAPARVTYRRALDADDASWTRGRGWALVQAIVALPYYVDTNRAMADTARHTLDALLE